MLLTGCASGGGTGPESTPIEISVTPGSFYSDSGIVRHGRTLWLAAVTSTGIEAPTVRIYRWSGTRWMLGGRVPVPEIPVSLGSWGGFERVSVTNSGAPDFALDSWGADTHWFAFVARVAGKWRAVPFDWVEGPAVGIVVDRVEGKLVLAATNNCGCAEGYGTQTWYRFERGLFVPTMPPGPAAPCSAEALNSAQPGDNWRRAAILTGADRHNLAAPFAAVRLACADGWAVARGTSNGRAVVGLFDDGGGTWAKISVIADNGNGLDGEAFTVPRSVLSRRLERKVGVQPKPLPKEREWNQRWTPDLKYETRSERATFTVPVTPGSTYSDRPVAEDESCFEVTVHPKPSATDRHPMATLYYFRWARSSWRAAPGCSVGERALKP